MKSTLFLFKDQDSKDKEIQETLASMIEKGVHFRANNKRIPKVSLISTNSHMFFYELADKVNVEKFRIATIQTVVGHEFLAPKKFIALRMVLRVNNPNA